MKKPAYFSPRSEAVDLGARESMMITTSNEEFPVTPQNPFGAAEYNDFEPEVL